MATSGKELLLGFLDLCDIEYLAGASDALRYALEPKMSAIDVHNLARAHADFADVIDRRCELECARRVKPVALPENVDDLLDRAGELLTEGVRTVLENASMEFQRAFQAFRALNAGRLMNRWACAEFADGVALQGPAVLEAYSGVLQLKIQLDGWNAVVIARGIDGTLDVWPRTTMFQLEYLTNLLWPGVDLSHYELQVLVPIVGDIATRGAYSSEFLNKLREHPKYPLVQNGPARDSNPESPAPEAGILSFDQRASSGPDTIRTCASCDKG